VDGFDRNEVDGRALTGTDVHRLEIQNLTFRDGRQASGNGGAISITGASSLGLRNSSFFNNHAGGKGGAVFFSEDPATGLSAGWGMSSNVSASRATRRRATRPTWEAR
jgi:predicted outer membrane repeat protein